LFDNPVIAKQALKLLTGQDKVAVLICAELQAFLFAEALDIPTRKLPTLGAR
jgi:hypothetical protein